MILMNIFWDFFSLPLKKINKCEPEEPLAPEEWGTHRAVMNWTCDWQLSWVYTRTAEHQLVCLLLYAAVFWGSLLYGIIVTVADWLNYPNRISFPTEESPAFHQSIVLPSCGTFPMLHLLCCPFFPFTSP